MSIKVTKIPQDAIIVCSIVPPVKLPGDVLDCLKETVQFKKEVNKHVYRIVSFIELGQDLPFGELVQGMGIEIKAEGGINDMEISSIYVGSTEWVVFGADAYRNQSQYGEVNVIHICSSVDEAIEVARKHMKSKETA
jgi:hypothetical protein